MTYAARATVLVLSLSAFGWAAAGCDSQSKRPAGADHGPDGSVASGGSTAGTGGATAGAGAVVAAGSAGRGNGGAGGGRAGATGSGGTSSGGSADAAAAGAGGEPNCDAGACSPIPAGLLDPDRTTRWNPGILSDGQLHMPLGNDGLPVRTEVCARPKPGDDLAAAIAGCPEGRVVELAAGTYMVSSTVTLDKGVVLRGAGSQGAANGGTTIVRNGGGSVLAIGSSQDGACYSSDYDAPLNLTGDAVKETATVHVGGDVSKFVAGDLALLDEVDDAAIDEGDCQYFKRVDHRSVSERVEVQSVDAASKTITLSSPLHWTFRSAAPHAAQLARVKGPITRWAGIEKLAVQGGANPGYDGQMAGGIDVSNAAHSWVKDVQTDGTIGGMHVALTGTYRVVVRDGTFHHSANYGFGQDCYGIVIRCGAADGLVENNVVRFMNKPILFNVSGGGNVVGYNYADNSWATPPAWQEVNIDTHCAFPHMELMEGNYAPHVGATITHGAAGYLTYFRNYSSSQFAPPAVVGSKDQQTGNIAALQFDTGDVAMNVIGNVLGSSAANDLGTAPVSAAYTSSGSDTPTIFELGDKVAASLFVHGNWDTVTRGVKWDPMTSVHVLPASLYLAKRPGWWPAGTPWPWAGSDLQPTVGKLPANERGASLSP